MLVDKSIKDLGEQFQNLFADVLKGGVKPIGKFLFNGTCRTLDSSQFAGILTTWYRLDCDSESFI